MGCDRPLLPNKPRGRGAGRRPACDHRDLLHSANRRTLARSARALRTSTTVYNRYNRWAKQGVWLRVFERLSEVTPDSLHLIDSSIVRAHQHATGGKKGPRITPLVAPVGD